MKKIFIYILLIIPNIFIAQQKKDSVKTEVIEVTRSYTPTVQDAYKLAINPDSIKVIEKKIPVSYRIQSVPVASTFQPEKGRMSQFQFVRHNENQYSSFASLAVGNHTNINAEAFVNYPVSDKLDAGVYVKHRSSQGDKNSQLINPYTHTKVDALLKYTQKKSQWNLDLGYLLRTHQFSPNLKIVTPSFPVIEETLYKEKRQQNIFNFNAGGKFTDFFVKDIQLNFQNFWDPYDNTENILNFQSTLNFPIGETQIHSGIKADMVSGTAFEKNINIPAIEKNYQNYSLGILPSFNYTNENLDVKLGFKLFYQNSNTNYKNIQFFPDVTANFNLIYEKLSVYGVLNGDIHQTSNMKLSLNNPYFVPMEIFPELMPLELYGGIRGSFSSAFSYDVKMGFRQMKNHPFYQTRAIYNYIPYGIVYDDLKQSFFATDLNVGVSKKLDFKFNFTYYQNNPEHLDKAFYMPDYILRSVILFHPTPKLDIDLSLFNYSKRPIEFENVLDVYRKSLEAFTDLNAEIRYHINKNFTGFIQANNILNKDYEIFYAYPVEKLQILGGVMYKFDFSDKNN